MPRAAPFTRLCQLATQPRSAGRADLHLHTTASDGTFTPAQIVGEAQRARLCAAAITDHDTLAGVVPAQTAAAAVPGLELIAGVEITAESFGRELHLLGLFVRVDDPDLNAALQPLRTRRAERFHAMIERLRARGVSVVEEDLLRASQGLQSPDSLGRRHLAAYLVQTRQAGSVREAFHRYLFDAGRTAVPKLRLPGGEAIARVRAAGGLASWAHPPETTTAEELAELSALGLGAVEIDYPHRGPARLAALRELAGAHNLLTTGGSDCHGPGDRARAVGARGVSAEELAALRERAAGG